MKMNAMKDALKSRRGRGLDITVLVGGEPVIHGKAHEPGDEQKDTDLAPPGEEHADAAQDKEIMHGAPQDGQDIDSDLTQGMSDYDKQDLMDRKPRSLGDRARQAALHKMKK